MIGRLGLVLLAVAALAGTASAAGRDPKDPKKRFNAADQAWARAIPIHRADLGRGDWRVEPSDDDDDDSDAPAGCKNPNMSDLVLTGESENPDFSLNGSMIGSGAEIWSSERHAAIAWKRGSSYPFAKCMAAAMKQEFAKAGGIKLTIQSSGPIPMSKLTPRMLTFRMRFRIKGPAGTFNGRFSLYFFSRGRADGMVMVVSFGRPLRPIPETLERRLATLVAERLKKR
jgi:hypothetical protein